MYISVGLSVAKIHVIFYVYCLLWLVFSSLNWRDFVNIHEENDIYCSTGWFNIALATNGCHFQRLPRHKSFYRFTNTIFPLFSSPEPLDSQGELIGWP